MTTRTLLLGAGGALALALAVPGGLALEVTDLDRDRVIVREPVRPGTVFALWYWHSIYQAPTWERFEVRADGRLRLRAIVSTREAVLEYYRLPLPVHRRDDGSVSLEEVNTTLSQILLRIDGIGRHRLLIGARDIHLLDLAGDGHRLLLRLRRVPRAAVLWHRMGMAGR